MSVNRSKVVIESNLKPSQFGRPASIVVDQDSSVQTSADDDFEKIYENPLEKLKPSPPSHSSICSAAVQAIASLRSSVGGENSGNYESNIKILNFDGDLKSGDEKKDAKIGYANRGFDQDLELYNRADADPSSKYKSNRSSAQDDANHHLIQLENRASVDREKIIISSTPPSPSIPPNSTHSLPIIEDKADISFRSVVNVIKSLDVNRYATKKTIAQGMLDIALLTANASQLKYILQVGKQHEFYTLMLSMICVSIGLQIFSGLLSLSLNLMRDCKMDDNSYARSVEWIGKARVALSFAVFLVLQGVICVLLGSTYNINKTQDQRKANIWNNICLILMVLTVSVNAVISAFDMRGSPGFDATATKGSGAAITGLTSSSGVR